MDEVCAIKGKIQEVERLLNTNYSDKATLEQRLETLRNQLVQLEDPQLLRISEAFKAFPHYGFLSCKKDGSYYEVQLRGTETFSLDGPTGGLAEIGYRIHGLYDWQNVGHVTLPRRILIVKF